MGATGGVARLNALAADERAAAFAKCCGAAIGRGPVESDHNGTSFSARGNAVIAPGVMRPLDIGS